MVRGQIKNCTPLWREVRFQVKIYKTRQLRTTFGSSDVEKLHAAVARSTFSSENVQNTPHFAVPMAKNRTALWREAHFQVKMYKTRQVRPLFAVPMAKNRTPLWREAHVAVKMLKN